mmetsp:Transcript_10112/g.25944  ORF Transcript_10112/g.25944 Transcript_10112/m.25944 type:complete len:230 (+) Transcript_10112:1826-2515(+)
MREPRVQRLSTLLAFVLDPNVARRHGAIVPLDLVPLQQSVDEFGAVVWAPLGHGELLELHVLLALEWELARNQAEHHHTYSPAVHLHRIVQLVELRRPIVLRAALLRQALDGLYLSDGAEVAKIQSLVHVLDQCFPHHEVVTLDVSVYAIHGVHPGNRIMHLLAKELDVGNRDHALGLPMCHHALDHIASPVEFQHHTHEHLLIINVVQLDARRMFQLLQHLGLFLDLS